MPSIRFPRPVARGHSLAHVITSLRATLRRGARCAVPALVCAAIPAAPVSAAGWTNEAAMVNSSTGRETLVLDPGIHEYWTRAELIRDHGGYYRGQHFGNVLAWAPQDVIDPGASAKWAGCGPSAPQVGDCPDGRGPLHQKAIGEALSASTAITALHWGPAFISLACGNFSEATTDGPPPPSISGTKFEDVDADGVRDASEPGLGDWRIELYQEGGGFLAATKTDANGDYSFTLDAQALPITDDRFELREVQQPGWEASRTPAVVHAEFGHPGASYGGNDFGNYRPATITGVKFDDHDVDRVRDSGEPGLEGWTISLSGGRSPDATAVTDPDGHYAFAGLIPGTYAVGETQQRHWRQSAPASGTHSITVRSGDTLTADFGNVCLGTARVAITEEGTGAPIDGVQVRLEEVAVTGALANEPPLPRTTTSPTFPDLLPGTYRVTTFLPDRVYTSDQDLTVVDGRLAVVKTVTIEECATTVVPIKLFSTSSGKVTGGMNTPAPGGSANAGFVFMTRQDQAEGSLEFQDRAADLNLHTKQIEQILVRDNEAWIGGLVEVDGTLHRFSLHLVDNGEPGHDDRFELLLDTGYRYGYGRTIDGGNVQIHPPAHAYNAAPPVG
jgi:hypothetical protein